MASQRQPEFVPLQRTPRRRVILRTAVAPFVWLLGLLALAVVVHRTDAIANGLLIAFGSLFVWTIVLLLLRATRNREQRRLGQAG
jgi:hypothetical protein